MCEVDKLDYVGFIAALFEYFRSDAVGEKCRKALLDKAVREKDVKVSALVNAVVYFVLTAGY